MNLNPHLHMLFVDGVYTFDDERPRFHGGCAPTQPELQRLLRTIATRVTRALERQGLLIRDDETTSLDLEFADGFEQLLGAAVHYRIATGLHAGRRALTLHTVASHPPASHPCTAQLSGFSLHAGTSGCSCTDIESDNDHADTSTTMLIGGLFFQSVARNCRTFILRGGCNERTMTVWIRV